MHSKVDTNAVRRFGRSSGAFYRFFAIFLALHIPLFIYPVARLCDWLDLSWMVTTLLLIPAVAGQTLVRWLRRRYRNRLSRHLSLVADFWLGVSPLMLMTLVVFEGLVLAGLVAKVPAAWSVLVISLCLGLCSMVNAVMLQVKRIAFDSPYLAEAVRFVQITDVHIGSRSPGFLRKVIGTVKELAPDFLCITGDFIDARAVPEQDLKPLSTLECPVYFSIGNHERYEDLDAILAKLGRLGVQVLRTDSVDVRDDLQVIGVDDRDDALQVERELGKLNVRRDAFVILLYHRPRGLEAAAKAGIDLMLSGHTHKGQIFPFNLVVRRFFERIAGMYRFGAARLYVSQGTGTWGPVMRFGTRSEITLFEVAPSTPL